MANDQIFDSRFDVCIILLYTVLNDARTLNIARTLVKHGKSVCIISLGNDAARTTLLAHGITLIPLAGETQGRFVMRWLDFARQVFPLLFRVKARSYWAADGYSLPFGLLFSAFHRAKFIYDSREIYSALGTLQGRAFTQRVIAAMECFCVRFVDKIFTSGQLDSEYLAKRFGIAVPKVVMNLPPYKPHQRFNLIRERFQLSATTRILVYQGMIFHGRGIMKVVEALPFLTDTVFVLFGDGDYADHVRKIAETLGVSHRVLFAGKVSYDELSIWTASADAGMTLIEPISFSYTLALPNKLFEYCMAGIPSLVSDLPAMRHVLEEHAIGRLVAPDTTPQELARIINECLTPEAKTDFRIACEQASKRFCWEAQEHIVLELAS